MKKLLFIGIFSIILAGCGDNKVTNEYLIGKWDCDTTTFTYINNLKQYFKLNQKKYHFNMEEKDGQLFTGSDVDERDFKTGKYSFELSDDTIINDVVAVKNGDSEFFVTIISDIYDKNSVDRSESAKLEAICTRIK
ncbi:hypothetical protein [Orbus mooreae]|uniref:hypothetical protein n=1 Tax=Orbus mooreae TaxID=3074107 RepID=UPI00370D2555